MRDEDLNLADDKISKAALYVEYDWRMRERVDCEELTTEEIDKLPARVQKAYLLDKTTSPDFTEEEAEIVWSMINPDNLLLRLFFIRYL